MSQDQKQFAMVTEDKGYDVPGKVAEWADEKATEMGIDSYNQQYVVLLTFIELEQ